MGRVPRRALLVAIGTMFLLVCTALAMAASHSGHASRGAPTGQSAAATCEICGKPIPTAASVVLVSAADRSQHHYACIHCALLAARDYIKGDVTVTTHSAVKGAKLEWTRTGGAWKVTPASAVVLSVPEVNGTCEQSHLAFEDQAEFNSFAKKHPMVHANPLPGARVDAILLAGRGQPPKEAVCPVMGNKVHPDASTEWTVYQGKVYYFCCPGCKPKFTSDPAGYVSGKVKASKPSHGGSCGGHSGAGGGCGGRGGSGSSRAPGTRGGKPATRSAPSQRA